MPDRFLRATRGDGDLEHLIEMYQGPLIRYASRLVGDPELAQDVVQETFLKYLERPLRFGEPRQWAAWLFRVTHNRCMDVLRQTSRRRALRQWIPLPSSADAPDAELARAEEHAELAQWLRRLKPEHRAVVSLYFDEDKTYKEIAAITGLSMSNVGMILHRSLKRLRKIADNERA